MKFWKKNSYTILLILVSCLTAASISYFNKPADENTYMTVKINHGDSLWSVADGLAKTYSLDREETISWMKKNNSLDGETILAGEELIVPVKKYGEGDGTELASAGGGN